MKESEEKILTPVEIEHQTFDPQGFGGYNIQEVDKFLRKVVTSFEAILRDNVELKERISYINERLQGYEKLEAVLKEALAAAQSASLDYLEIKKKEADLLLQEARIEREKIMSEAARERDNLQKEIIELKNVRKRFKIEFETLLKTHLEMSQDNETA